MPHFPATQKQLNQSTTLGVKYRVNFPSKEPYSCLFFESSC